MATALVDAPGRRGVLNAAAELFVSQGYEGTTLRQIASLAGIKAGSIYHHFDSKEALFLAVLRDGMTVMVEAFERADEQPSPSSVDQRLAAHVFAHLSAIFENGPYTSAHVTALFSSPAAVKAAIVPMRDAYEKRWNELFTELFTEHDPATLHIKRLILFGSMNATTEWFDPKGAVSLPDLATTISDHFLHGMRTHA